MVRKHYNNFRYSANMLKKSSRDLYGAELGSNILIFKTYIDSPNRY